MCSLTMASVLVSRAQMAVTKLRHDLEQGLTTFIMNKGLSATSPNSGDLSFDVKGSFELFVAALGPDQLKEVITFEDHGRAGWNAQVSSPHVRHKLPTCSWVV